MKYCLNISGSIFFLFLCILFTTGCGPTLAERKISAQSAMDALQRSQFQQSLDEADRILEEDPENPYAALVHAISLYKKTMHQLFIDAQTMAIGAAVSRHVNTRYLHTVIEDADKDLAQVDKNLSIAAQFPQMGMSLCLACLEVDWNRNGRVDDRDRVLLQVEQDVNEKPIPKGDPRRTPTFRFDHGDILWARAFISFQRAVLQFASAYDWSAIGTILQQNQADIRIPLLYPENMHNVQTHIVGGLGFSEAARQAYLAETDDDREWLPNPTQKNHPLPMPVDQALYDTWEFVVADLTRLVEGSEGLSVSEMAQLGDHQWDNPPRGYLNIGKLLSDPKDIVLNLDELEDHIDNGHRQDDRDAIESALKMIFGDYYVMQMKSSPLLQRMDRMKQEVLVGKESFERKLRYLLWVN